MGLAVIPQGLLGFVEGLRGQDIEAEHGDAVFFTVGSFSASAYLKAGGSRVRGSVYLDAVDDVDEAIEWIKGQPMPRGALLEVALGDQGDDAFLRLLFERAVGKPPAHDPLLGEASRYARAWQSRGTVRPVSGDRPWTVGDPRGLPPVNAWLLKGSERSYPSEEEIRGRYQDGRAGIFDLLWTAAKQTEVGDLAFIYFAKPRSAVHFVCRAASRAFFDRTIKVAAEGGVAQEQWWAYFTPPVEIEPIPLDTLRQHASGHLPLRGRSGLYLRPDTVAGLPIKPRHVNDGAEVTRVAVTPVGSADLPDPKAMSFTEWRSVASGALRLEADVSRYVVEPLLRLALEQSASCQREYPLGRKSADYVVLVQGAPRSVIEVKLATRQAPDGVWSRSRDFVQLRGYADQLQCPGALIDANRVLLVARDGDQPVRTIVRRYATEQDLAAIREHLTG